MIRLDYGLLVKKYYVPTGHGSPYKYDTQVPILIRAPGVPPQTIDRRVPITDLAPTLAGLLDVYLVGFGDSEGLEEVVPKPERYQSGE